MGHKLWAGDLWIPNLILLIACILQFLWGIKLLVEMRRKSKRLAEGLEEVRLLREKGLQLLNEVDHWDTNRP